MMAKKQVQTQDTTPVEAITQPAEVVPMNDALARDLIRLLWHHADQVANFEKSHAKLLPTIEPDNDNPNAIVQQARKQVAHCEQCIASNLDIAARLYRQLVQAGATNIESKMDRYAPVPRSIPGHVMSKVKEHASKHD
jgi:hypothetical protein